MNISRGAIGVFFCVPFFVLTVAACSGSDGTSNTPTSNGTSSSSSSGSSGNSTSGSSSSSGGSSGKATDTNPTLPAGKSCGGVDDCAYWYCDCKDGSVVNSRACTNGTCQAPAAHCPDACNTFGHGGWKGTAGGGDQQSSSSSSSSSTSSSSSSTSGGGSSSGGGGGGAGATCNTKDDCGSFTCGCTDGSRLNVQDCENHFCSDAASGCENACVVTGHGDWDGT